jgi:hypothetical protein
MNQLRDQRRGCFVADRLRQNTLSAVAFTGATVLLALSSFVSGTFDSRAADSAKRADHWAFKAPVRPESPSVKDKAWPRTAIDAFILARLEKEGLKPSPEADKITLLRRLHFDLTGLPPTISETDAFLQDTSPDAYAKLVERLLNSPHYGERWGRHWLDAARYADSNGYEKDRAREMWHYRDWVIGSFQRDLPYNQFILEQVAGDLLPGASQDQIIATGFFRNSMINEEGAIDPEQFRMDAMFDRMDALGKGVLGLTIQCAQCHNHKYDPLTQEEYYRLFAFLNNADELTAPIYFETELAQRERVLREIRELESELQRQHPDWAKRMAAWEETVRGDQPEWIVLDPYEYGAPDGLSKLQRQNDKSLLAGGHPFTGGTWFVKARTMLTNIAAVRLETLVNANLPMHGPGRSANGLFALQEFRLQAAPSAATNFAKVAFSTASADFEQPQQPPGEMEKEKDFFGPVKFAIDDNPKTFWAIDAGPGRRNTDRKAVFQTATNFGFPGGTELRFDLACRDEVACFRLSLTTATNPVADPLPKNVRDIIDVPRERRSPDQTAAVFSYWRTLVPEFAEANARIAALWKDYPEPNGTALTLAARPEPRNAAVLNRGDWLKPGKSVTPGVPAFLHALPANAGDSRLALGRWLVDKKSPTTARVFVNRVWQAYFGTGLVGTPEDFGMQADTPSHRELLDWLACEFMEPTNVVGDEGQTARPLVPWSVKHLHRLVVLSATYRQSSKFTPELQARDPYNRLLARGPRVRVEGEIVRDVALAASGLLETNVGGPSVYTPAPAFLFTPPSSYVSFPWKDATGPDRYRRALYTFRRRSTPYPMLQTFDTPNGDVSCVRRARSNSPLQALTSLNETLFIECAQALARRMATEGGASDAERVGYAFRCVLSRPPTAREQQEMLGLIDRQRRHISEGWVSANQLATGTNAVPADLPKSTTPTQLAAYTVLSRVLLNLDEAITKE